MVLVDIEFTVGSHRRSLDREPRSTAIQPYSYASHTYAGIPPPYGPIGRMKFPRISLSCLCTVAFLRGNDINDLTGAIGLCANGLRMPQVQYIPFENAVL